MQRNASQKAGIPQIAGCGGSVFYLDWCIAQMSRPPSEVVFSSQSGNEQTKETPPRRGSWTRRFDSSRRYKLCRRRKPIKPAASSMSVPGSGTPGGGGGGCPPFQSGVRYSRPGQQYDRRVFPAILTAVSNRDWGAIVKNLPAYHCNDERTCGSFDNSQGTAIRKVHTRIPGRARFMVTALYRSECVKQCLEAGLRRIAGIKSVKGNVLTGNLLVVFAHDRSVDEIAVLVLQQLNAGSASSVTLDTQLNNAGQPGPSDENALAGIQRMPIGLVGPSTLIYVPLGFLGSFTVGLLQMSPVLIFLTLSIIMMGQIVGRHEGWSRGDALYFSFVTATTVGYGDLRPTKTISKALSVGISFVGLVFTGIVAAIGLNSAQHAFDSKRGLVTP